MKKIVFVALLSFLCLASCNKKAEITQNEPVVIKTDIVEDERTGDELKIVATIIVKPEAIKSIMPLFQTIVQKSQEEEGCISYNLHQDLADSTKFFMLEEWKSQAAIDFHNNTEHFKNFGVAAKDMLVKTEVSIVKLVY